MYFHRFCNMCHFRARILINFSRHVLLTYVLIFVVTHFSHSRTRILIKSRLDSVQFCTSLLQKSHSEPRILFKSRVDNVHFCTSPLQTSHSELRCSWESRGWTLAIFYRFLNENNKEIAPGSLGAGPRQFSTDS